VTAPPAVGGGRCVASWIPLPPCGNGSRALAVERPRIRMLHAIAVGCGALMVPLAAYRWYTGSWQRALFNLGVAGMCALLAARLREAQRLGRLAWAVAVVPFAASVATHFMDTGGVSPWLFPCLVTYFLILGCREATFAAVVNLATLAVLSVAVLHQSAVQLVTMVVTAIWTTGLMVAMVTEVEQKQGEIERLATSDPLTGVGNRRALEQALQEAGAEQARHGTRVSLLALDLDHFKTVNDRFGHEVGDQTLVTTVALLESRARATDRVYRTGGEEFIMLLRHTGEEEAQVLGESLRALFAERLTAAGSPVTGSFGCAERRPGEAASSWMVRADRALYAAKRQGRNRVVMAAMLPEGGAAGPFECSASGDGGG